MCNLGDRTVRHLSDGHISMDVPIGRFNEAVVSFGHPLIVQLRSGRVLVSACLRKSDFAGT